MLACVVAVSFPVYADENDIVIATPSETIDYDRINQNIDAILSDRLPSDIGIEMDDVSYDVQVAAVDEMAVAVSDDTYHKNVVVFHGRFDNRDCDLVVPYSAYAQLDIINGVIVNVGNTNVTGRILYDGDLLNPSEYDTYSYIMNQLYGSTNNVYQYGSFNYQRHYYLQTSSGYDRITYTDTYGRAPRGACE